MAKKKKSEDVEEDLDDEDFGDLGGDDIELAVPKLGKKKEIGVGEEYVEDEMEEGGLEEELEPLPEEEIPDYKYLDLDILKLEGANYYEVQIPGQSHGLLNIMVKDLLETEGVSMAAYKVNKLDPPKIFIKLENDKHKIKDILYDCIERLKSDVQEIQKMFLKIV